GAVSVIESKLAKKLVRRLQFASLVATRPWESGAMYRLIAKPGTVDSISLGGVAGSSVIDRLKASSLMTTGNVLVPVKVAENLYLTGDVHEALKLVRRARGREAQPADGRMSLFAGDLDRAMSIFSAAMDRQATKADACRYLAQCYYLKDDLDRAGRTVSIGAAIWPRAAPLMTLFSRIVRNGEDIRRFLDEKVRVARNGFTMGTAAQFVRACGRAGAVE